MGKNDWDEIRTRAPEETSALNWRLRPLGHPIMFIEFDAVILELQNHVSIEHFKTHLLWGSNPRPQD